MTMLSLLSRSGIASLGRGRGEGASVTRWAPSNSRACDASALHRVARINQRAREPQRNIASARSRQRLFGGPNALCLGQNTSQGGTRTVRDGPVSSHETSPKSLRCDSFFFTEVRDFITNVTTPTLAKHLFANSYCIVLTPGLVVHDTQNDGIVPRKYQCVLMYMYMSAAWPM